MTAPASGETPSTAPATRDHPHRSTHGDAVLHDLIPLVGNLRRAIPSVYGSFDGLAASVLADGALDRKSKELIALVIGIVKDCDGCIASHARAAVRAGATREEAAEAIAVTFLMDGGPATVHGARAYDAFCSYADEAAPGTD